MAEGTESIITKGNKRTYKTSTDEDRNKLSYQFINTHKATDSHVSDFVWTVITTQSCQKSWMLIYLHFWMNFIVKPSQSMGKVKQYKHLSAFEQDLTDTLRRIGTLILSLIHIS